MKSWGAAPARMLGFGSGVIAVEVRMSGRDSLVVPGSDGDSFGPCFAQQGASSQGMGTEAGLGKIDGKNGLPFSGQQE